MSQKKQTDDTYYKPLIWTVQYHPHPSGQRFWIEGFLDKYNLRVEYAMMDDDVVGVARHKQHFEVGLLFG